MKMTILICVALWSLAWVAHASDISDQIEQYLCVVEKISGFVYDKDLKQWDTVRFRIGKKYRISRLSDEGYQITKVGENNPTGSCEKGFTNQGILLCDMPSGKFRFNRNNGRFLTAYFHGYYNVPSDLMHTPSENDDTPSVAIGTCSRS